MIYQRSIVVSPGSSHTLLDQTHSQSVALHHFCWSYIISSESWIGMTWLGICNLKLGALEAIICLGEHTHIRAGLKARSHQRAFIPP